VTAAFHETELGTGDSAKDDETAPGTCWQWSTQAVGRPWKRLDPRPWDEPTALQLSQMTVSTKAPVSDRAPPRFFASDKERTFDERENREEDEM